MQSKIGHLVRHWQSSMHFWAPVDITDDLSKTFLHIATTLFALMRKKVEFVWTDECWIVFDSLKNRLTSEPILALPNDDVPYILYTDASDCGLGAVLSQKQDGIEHIISYASRALPTSGCRYETTRKELLAVVVGLTHFHQYLLGRHFCHPDWSYSSVLATEDA